MPRLFDDYATGQAYDEMFDADTAREPYLTLSRSFADLDPDDVATRVEALRTAYLDQGVTFDIGGEERAFPLDIVPRVIEMETWQEVDAGVQQRVRALEAFLADVYDAGQVFEDGVIPRSVVATSSHFHREAGGVRPPNGVRVHVSGIDLIRDDEGNFRVLEDNVRVPSGVSYVMTNRRSIAAALPEAFSHHRIRPVASYPQRLLAALRAAAPAGVTDPTVVVLTPGVYNGAYFEHALLARTMGVELVEGRDLQCRRGRVMMRTTHGLEPVHVIYRRVDDEFLDPVHFRGDSLLGCPGLIDAARSGQVTLANAVGNGVADDKLVYTYVPDLIRYYLSEEPILRNVDTWRLGDADAREEVMDRLAELVVKPVDGSGGKGIVIGPAASRAELDELRTRVMQDPRSWIAQPVVQLSTVPTYVDGTMAARHVDLRPFAVNDGQRVWVLPGGLTRVALEEGQLIVNSSRGGGSKDTWVLAGTAPPRVAREEPPTLVPVGRPPSIGPAMDDIAALVEDQQLQQQQQHQQGPDVAGAPQDDTGRCRVLSRIAESMFWIGRYVERAEDTARILDVQTQLLLEDSTGDEETTCRNLLSVMGVEPPTDSVVDLSVVLGLLAYDATAPASIAAVLAAARESARRARETLSVTMWEALNTTHRHVASGQFRRMGQSASFRWVRDRAALINGAADASMTRDEGWQFLILGRTIERADMTSRLVATASLAGGVGSPWSSTLRACGGHEAFLRTYKGLETERGAAEFLLLDRLFPRSVVFALSRAEQCLDNLESGQRAGFQNEAHRLIGRTRAELEYRPLADVIADLPAEMERLQLTCLRATEAISHRYFAGSEGTHWMGGRDLMQLRIVHTTGFEYDGLALASYNQARMTPQTGPGQIVVHTRLGVSPTPWTYDYRDYFGNEVTSFEVLDPHESMTVTAVSTVHTDRPPTSLPALGWEDLAAPEVADRWTEYLELPALVAPPEDLAALVRDLAARAGTPGEAARDICSLVHAEVSYRPGSTDAATPAVDAWTQRGGVCQDMAHLVLGCLRSIGIPARYVSGYLHPQVDARIGETVQGESHAWVEWWDEGWHGFDPTNDKEPGDRWVVVATGRDYLDVRPLHGIYSGARTSSMFVRVDVTRIA